MSLKGSTSRQCGLVPTAGAISRLRDDATCKFKGSFNVLIGGGEGRDRRHYPRCAAEYVLTRKFELISVRWVHGRIVRSGVQLLDVTESATLRDYVLLATIDGEIRGEFTIQDTDTPCKEDEDLTPIIYDSKNAEIDPTKELYEKPIEIESKPANPRHSNPKDSVNDDRALVSEHFNEYNRYQLVHNENALSLDSEASREDLSNLWLYLDAQIKSNDVDEFEKLRSLRRIKRVVNSKHGGVVNAKGLKVNAVKKSGRKVSARVVTGIFSEKRRSVSLKWTLTDAKLMEESIRNVTFRLRYRTTRTATIFQIFTTKQLRLDCELQLRRSDGRISSAQLPSSRDCRVRLPVAPPRYGLLVQLRRLNIPCAIGHVHLSSPSPRRTLPPLCGKLEELPLADRQFYYTTTLTRTDPSINLHGSPTFTISYKFVDYCYNITLNARNGSFELGPTNALQCTYKVHLPYGNKVALRLEMGEKEIKRTRDNQNHEHDSLHVTTVSPGNDAIKECTGMSITLLDGSKMWQHCSQPGDPLRNVEIISNENSVILRIHIKRTSEYFRTESVAFDSEGDIETFRTYDSVSGFGHNDRRIRGNNSEGLMTEIIGGEKGLFLRAWYHAEPIEEIVGQCSYGWVAMRQNCVSAFLDTKLQWAQADFECQRHGGHLVSITSEQAQIVIDQLLLKSPGIGPNGVYWIGATDAVHEGDFQWSDKQPFSYAHWFPGWQKQRGQPNDDGMSRQDCVEVRRAFPAGARLAPSFMWNDRACHEHNFFVCARPRSDEPYTGGVPICNQTIALSRERPHAAVSSPGFPRAYPDNMRCLVDVLAPAGHAIELDFEEMVLEKEADCTYDYLEIIEFNPANRTISGYSEWAAQLASSDETNIQAQNDVLDPDDSVQVVTEFGSITRMHSSGLVTKKICDDWSPKLKLLRYVSKGSRLRLRFVSDYSHHFGGYKARLSVENALSCSDSRLKFFKGYCYLFAGYPRLNWQTAHEVCEGMGAHLASIHSPEEQHFVTSGVRNSVDYGAGVIYWLGARSVRTDESRASPEEAAKHFSVWSDGTRIHYDGWMARNESVAADRGEMPCLAIQWKSSPSNPMESGLYWTAHKCSQVGGFVCKRQLNSPGHDANLNTTIEGTSGNITSMRYPTGYDNNLDYWVKIIGPEHSRIVIEFIKIDLEFQKDCQYDYVEVTSNEFSHAPLKCGSFDTDMNRFNFVSDGNRAFVHFHSDYSVSGAGFSLTWRAVPMTGCPTQTLTAKEGSLISPNYPHFLLPKLDCVITILAPSGKRIWLDIVDYDFGTGQYKNGLPYNVSNITTTTNTQSMFELNLGEGSDRIVPFQTQGHLSGGLFLSESGKLQIRLSTQNFPAGIGFKAFYKTVTIVREEKVLQFSQHTKSSDIGLIPVNSGLLLHLNYPAPPARQYDLTWRLVAPVGYTLHLKFRNVIAATGSTKAPCGENEGWIEIIDTYADTNGTTWALCEGETTDLDRADDSISFTVASYLHILTLRQCAGSKRGIRLNVTVVLQNDAIYENKLLQIPLDMGLDSCNPNLCLHGGRCLTSEGKSFCECFGHYRGLFCSLTACQLRPCLYGDCVLQTHGFKCSCHPGYSGHTCSVRIKACASNPCSNKGACLEKDNSFMCQCNALWKGARCEIRDMRYKPLSQRMLQEPFWLGLITVFVVLGVIGLVWCAKRHFPEKIEKLLAEEADRCRPAHSSVRCSSREAAAAAAGAAAAAAPAPGATPRSLFTRLGIRKPSILSLASAPALRSTTTQPTAARTFSLDDLLKPPPRRSPSPRKKRNNSTPTKKNAAEKKQILQQLISPASGKDHVKKITMGELMQMSENKINNPESTSTYADSSVADQKETSFMNSEGSSSSTSPSIRQLNDPKLEKKVTFARLLNKVSAEMSSSSEVDTSNNIIIPMTILNDKKLIKSSSTPPSPGVDVKSPHSTSSNQGSDSFTSLDINLPMLGLKKFSRSPKISSADSILAMFRNFSSSTAGVTRGSSTVVSTSTTPTASSPQEDIPGDDDSTTSSIPTPISFSSSIPDSPILYRSNQSNTGNTIEIQVLDSLSAHKSNLSGSNFLHPPTILLEVPSTINKCLSPIRELPTPLPSPALTPLMPRSRACSTDYDEIGVDMSDDRISLEIPSVSLSHSEDEEDMVSSQEILAGRYQPGTPNSVQPGSRPNSSGCLKLKLRPPLSGIDTSTPSTQLTDTPSPLTQSHDSERELSSSCGRTTASPRDLSPAPTSLVIPLLTVEQPSPTSPYQSYLALPGSPPPHRSSIGETNFVYPQRQLQKRLLKEYDKPTSLDLPMAPPLITVTCNMSEAESDVDPMSPGPTNQSLAPPRASNMCYLSPFSMCTRNDRATSESNLSSSGYSSMASPGPSRCGSNNPLCPSEMEDPGSGSGSSLHPTYGHRRPSPLLKTNSSPGSSSTLKNNNNDQKSHCRGRSDSETLSDDPLLESNDEGIGTDHLEEKIDDSELKSAKELEVFITNDVINTEPNVMSKNIAKSVEKGIDRLIPPMVPSKSTLQLPSIIIHSETSQTCDKLLSPVSSRSESPLSDKTGFGRFSPQFYGRHKEHLPFTDSDGLYDFPSSDCVHQNSNSTSNIKISIGTSTQSHRKTMGRRRDRKSPRAALSGNLSPSSTKSQLPHSLQNLLDVPGKEVYFRTPAPRKLGPKKRSRSHHPVSSSSSSSESIHSAREIRISSDMKSSPSPDTVIWKSQEWQSSEDTVEDTLISKIPSHMDLKEDIQKKPQTKISRLRTISNQIRFLRRLEQSLKMKERSAVQSDEEGDDLSSVTSPLLQATPAKSQIRKSQSITKMQVTSPTQQALRPRMTRQKRGPNDYLLQEDECLRTFGTTISNDNSD